MKHLKLRIICALAAAMPMMASAQQNIVNAFDKIIDKKDANIVETHTLERNPETGVKTGQSDIYRFTLPESDMPLIKNAIKAFKTDSEKAYSMSSGHTMNTENDIILAVGEGNNNGVELSSPDCDYIYSCFLAPKSEDPTGNYRYAYAMNYKTEDGKIIGKLVVTYATTMKYRQDQKMMSERMMSGMRFISPDTWNMMSNPNDAANPGGRPADSWFKTFMKYVQSMDNASAQTRLALATEIYELSQKINEYKDVTNQDKNTARGILKSMVEDPRYKDVVKQLLNNAIINIK